MKTDNQSWANELVAMWCSHEASELCRRARIIRRRYAKSGLPEQANEFASMLERHAAGFLEKQRQFLRDSE